MMTGIKALLKKWGGKHAIVNLRLILTKGNRLEFETYFDHASDVDALLRAVGLKKPTEDEQTILPLFEQESTMTLRTSAPDALLAQADRVVSSGLLEQIGGVGCRYRLTPSGHRALAQVLEERVRAPRKGVA